MSEHFITNTRLQFLDILGNPRVIFKGSTVSFSPLNIETLIKNLVNFEVSAETISKISDFDDNFILYLRVNISTARQAGLEINHFRK
jgi:hypothetical protein